VVVTIGPSLQYSGAAYNNSSYAQCFQFSPNPAVVKTNQVIQWRNNTNSAVTVAGSGAVPWVSVGPGATSAGLTFQQAGSVRYGLLDCHPTSANAGVVVDTYATVAVTIN
jgi:plastocyanin